MKRAGLILFILLGVLAGCGRGKAPQVENASTPENIPVSLPSGPGSIRGKVLFSGTASQPVALDMAADPICAGAHSGPVYAQDLTVDADHGVRDAFVYIKQGLPEGAVYPVPAEPVTLNQQGCQYSPHVFGIRTNQTLTLVNSDSTLHNVHAQLKNSPEFNLGMPLQGMKSSKKFPHAEVMAHLKCDVHPWMSAYAGVVDHPFFAVTAEDGSFEIKGLPKGDYMLSIWHEKLGVQNTPVEVREGVSEVFVNYNS